MKNWEFYEKELRDCDSLDAIAITKSGKMVECVDINCGVCAFHFSNGGCGQDKIIEFLYQEHEERIALTEDEQMLCSLLGRGWIARDKNGNLYWYEKKPTKDFDDYQWCSSGEAGVFKITKAFLQCKFNFIQWKDKEPWEVRDREAQKGLDEEK